MELNILMIIYLYFHSLFKYIFFLLICTFSFFSLIITKEKITLYKKLKSEDHETILTEYRKFYSYLRNILYIYSYRNFQFVALLFTKMTFQTMLSYLTIRACISYNIHITHSK